MIHYEKRKQHEMSYYQCRLIYLLIFAELYEGISSPIMEEPSGTSKVIVSCITYS